MNRCVFREVQGLGISCPAVYFILLSYYATFLSAQSDPSFMLRSLTRLSLTSPSSKSILSRFKHSMRLIQFVEGGTRRVGVETKDGGDVVDVSAGEPSIPSDMRSFLEGGGEMLKKAQRWTPRAKLLWDHLHFYHVTAVLYGYIFFSDVTPITTLTPGGGVLPEKLCKAKKPVKGYGHFLEPHNTRWWALGAAIEYREI